tara:strand:- start:5162 stop:5416 length:255 start_codon:yes stop_codon:yes gene_type:complete
MPDEKKYLKELEGAVNNPNHYNQNGKETIELIKESMTEEEFSGYLRGNVLKYVCRYKHKGMPLKDLMKANWYINRLIEETKDND